MEEASPQCVERLLYCLLQAQPDASHERGARHGVSGHRLVALCQQVLPFGKEVDEAVEAVSRLHVPQGEGLRLGVLAYGGVEVVHKLYAGR